MKNFLLGMICFSLLLFTASCSRQESLASASLNPVFDGQAFAAGRSIRIEGKPITQTEILELIEKSRPHWLKLIEQDPSFQGAKEIRVSKYGYSILNYEERRIKLDLIHLPFFGTTNWSLSQPPFEMADNYWRA